MLFEEMIKDAKGVPQTITFKIKNGLATLADQDEALKNPQSAYLFAHWVKGADIEKCQEVAYKDPRFAYCFAFKVQGANIEKCQDAACKDPMWAYVFALRVPGADIEKCKKVYYNYYIHKVKKYNIKQMRFYCGKRKLRSNR